MLATWPLSRSSDRRRSAQRARQRLEARLGDVVRVLAIEQFEVQADAGVHREGLEEFLEQLGVDLPDLVAREAHLPDQVGPVAQVDRGARQRFVHRNIGVAEADDAGIAAHGFLERLAQHDADVFHRVVLVDVEVALGLDVNVHGGVLGEALEHVVEEPDARGNRRFSRAIDVHGDLDLRSPWSRRTTSALRAFSAMGGASGINCAFASRT